MFLFLRDTFRRFYINSQKIQGHIKFYSENQDCKEKTFINVLMTNLDISLVAESMEVLLVKPTCSAIFKIRDWPRRPNPDGRTNKNWTAENIKPEGRTERTNLTRRPNIF